LPGITLYIIFYLYYVLIPVLYGEDISRDFSPEFKVIENMFEVHTNVVWDGNRNIDENMYSGSETDLKRFFPEGSFSIDIKSRFLHSIGKSSPEILESRYNASMPIVEGVVYPEYNNLNSIMDGIKNSGLKALVFGGGTNVTGCFRLKPGSGVIAIDTSRLNSISLKGNTVTVGSGTYGPELEKTLNSHGYTCGNFPESFNYSTVGGWIGTLENGQESNQYGGIENAIISVRAITSQGEIDDRIVPRESSGFPAKSAFLGSEGKYGLIVEATLKTFRQPAKRFFKSYFFKSFNDGIEAIRTMDRFPTILRLSDETETSIAISSGGDSSLKRLFLNYLKMRGVGKGAMMIGVNNNSQFPDKISGGISAGSFAARQWFRERYTRPAMANILWKHGYVPDTLETSAMWDVMPALHESTIQKFHSIEKERGFKGIIMAHLSHMYETGACIYFTFIIRSENAMEDLSAVRESIMNNFIKMGAALSDHHGMGTYLKKYQHPNKIRMQSLLDDNLFSGWKNE